MFELNVNWKEQIFFYYIHRILNSNDNVIACIEVKWTKNKTNKLDRIEKNYCCSRSTPERTRVRAWMRVCMRIVEDGEQMIIVFLLIYYSKINLVWEKNYLIWHTLVKKTQTFLKVSHLRKSQRCWPQDQAISIKEKVAYIYVHL